MNNEAAINHLIDAVEHLQHMLEMPDVITRLRSSDYKAVKRCLADARATMTPPKQSSELSPGLDKELQEELDHPPKSIVKGE